MCALGTSLAVQWLRLYIPNAGGTCSIPGWGTKISHAAWCQKKIAIKLVCFKYRPIFSYFRDNCQKLAQFYTFGAKYLQIIPERHIVPLWFMDQL